MATPMEVKTVDITPTWKAAARILLMTLEDGTEEGKQMARTEVLRMAGLLDSLIDERNARFMADTDTGEQS